MKARYDYPDGLKSQRLITRLLTVDDVAAWARFFEDEDALEFIPTFGHISALEAADLWIGRQLERYRDNRLGLQALIDQATGELVGLCGLLLQEVDGALEIEVGYHILKEHWGKGYAPEAARLFIESAFRRNLADSVISIIDTKNRRSQRVADKNGLVCEKQTDWNGMDVYIYRISKDQWTSCTA